MKAPAISIVLLNFNTVDLTLASLARLAGPAAERSWQLIVVDNSSSDGSADAVRRKFGTVELVEAAENRGYAAGNNLGLRRARGESVVLLNTDVVAQADDLAALCRRLQQQSDNGARSAKLLTADGTAQAFAFGSDPAPLALLRRGLLRLAGRPAQNWDVRVPLETDWVSGACLAVRRSTFEEVGLLDEDFFLYFEDVDWCRRMRRSGWRVLYDPAVTVTHLGGASQPQRHIANRHYDRSLILFYRKHYGAAAALLLASALRIARRGASLRRA